MPDAMNIWEAVRSGQQAEQGMAQANLEGLSLRERQALKKAAATLGNQNYFAGYEGVAGAERPAYLKEAWANASPDDALRLESLIAEPFKLNRMAEQAGKIEAAKKASDLEYGKNMMRAFYDSEGGQQASAIGGNVFGQTMMSPGGGVLAPGQQGHVQQVNPSAVKRTFEITPQGPRFGAEHMSDFEQSMKRGEDEARRAVTKLGVDKLAQEKSQSAEANFFTAQKQLQDGLSAAQTHDSAPGMIDELYRQYWRAKKDLQAVQQGTTVGPEPSVSIEGIASPPTASAPSVMPSRAPQTRASADGSSVPMNPAPLATPSVAPSSLLTEKDRAALEMKDREGQSTDARKLIVEAVNDSMTAQSFKRQAQELHNIVTKASVGNAVVDGVPLAGNVMSFWRDNAQVKKLNENIINMFIKPGQSQVNNTIVERQMTGAQVPGLYTEPQLNRVLSAILMSNIEHRQKYPGFLEQWKRTHGGTLEGASEAWVDYADNNNRYVYGKDARGTVTVKKQESLIEPKVWAQLREMNAVEVIPGNGGSNRVFIKQPNGKFKEVN